jgi:hypothetical protein
MGELLSAESEADSVLLTFKPLVSAYKPVPSSAAKTFAVHTTSSSAACGVSAEIGSVYVVFAHPSEQADQYQVDSCSGTRVHLSRSSDEAVGFSDVPARFVVQQLNGLAGMELLGAVSRNYPDPSDPANAVLIGLLDVKVLARTRRRPAAAFLTGR